MKKFEKINEFWNAKIIIVNKTEKPYFRISSPPYLDKEDNFICAPLFTEDCFKISKEVYEKFESLVEKYLK